MLSDEDRSLMSAVVRYLEHANAAASADTSSALTPLGERISAHLGTDASAVPVVAEQLADHRLVDADLALASLFPDAILLGVGGGGDQRHHTALAEWISNPHTAFSEGAVDYAERATGPDTTMRVVATGVRLVSFEGAPLAISQRSRAPRYGRDDASIEVIGTDPDLVTRFLRVLREEMIARSVLRGKVLSFQESEYGAEAGATFLQRPAVDPDDIVLPDGVLQSVIDHVVGIGEHRDALLRAGQHLKRGALLYGPPGTGKTLTVRHLLSATPDVTAVLLTGSSIRFVTAAAEIARTFAPAIVVLEDIDLVAMERSHSPEPLLFEVLDALDGLDGDADVAFVMTTNRVDVLERALAQRPGRVDLAVEIPLPGPAERERLFRSYARDLAFSDDAIRDAAERAEGVTGSFAKELVRRSVLRASRRGDSATDDDLAAELERLLDDREHLTRAMLGGAHGGEFPDDDGGFPNGESYYGSFHPLH